jgi:hypothetical protein
MTPPRTLAELTGEGFDAWIGFDELVWLRVDDGPLSVADQVALGAFLALVAGGLTTGGGKI